MKMQIKKICLTLLIILGVTLSVSSVSAQCVVPVDDLLINSDTILCSGTYNIDDVARDGAIIINSNDVALECSSALLNGTGFGAGIVVEGRNNVNITNCNVERYYHGLRISSSTNVRVTDSAFNSNSRSGVVLDSSSSNTLTRVTALSNFIAGIEFLFSNSNSLFDVITSGNKYGLYLTSSTGNVIRGLSSFNDFKGVAFFSSSNNLVEKSNVTKAFYAIYNILSVNNVTNTNLENNSFFNYFNNHSVNVTAQLNWWGTKDCPEIERTIWDFNDDSSLGDVEFEPFLDAPYPFGVPTVCDAFPPVTSKSVPDSDGDGLIDGTVTLTCSDAESGCAVTRFSIDGGSFVDYTGLFEIPDDAQSHTVSFFSIDNAGNEENVTIQEHVRDRCPNVSGPLERQGCPVADENLVELHIIDQAKRGDCGGKGSCKLTLSGVSVRVFDRNDPNFQALFTKNPKGTRYADVYESGVGQIASCTTGGDGRCIAGETTIGDYLVIVKHTDPETGKIVYTGKPKSPSDFVDGVAFKDFQIIKLIKKNGDVDFKGGSKTVVTGSLLEIIYPLYTIWDSNNTLYPFIFTSDSSWTTNVCLQVPAGYNIVGVLDENGNIITSADCAQTFVASETKVIVFEVVETSSPEPDVLVSISAKAPTGAVTQFNLDIPGERVEIVEEVKVVEKQRSLLPLAIVLFVLIALYYLTTRLKKK